MKKVIKSLIKREPVDYKDICVAIGELGTLAVIVIAFILGALSRKLF